MRLFVAIVPPAPLPARLHAIQERLRAIGAHVKWEEVSNLHVTLKFLGETPETSLPELRRALRDVVPAFGPFPLRLAGAGFFPPRGTPRVVWVGLGEGLEALRRLHASIEAACRPLGFAPEDRPFSAHVTLGRVRSAAHEDALKKEIAKLRDEVVGTFEVSEFSLMESKLTPRGAIYTHVEDYPLAPGP